MDLIDIKPSKGKFTWSNKRSGLGHIADRLDIFVKCFPVGRLPHPLFSILPWAGSDHRPISLLLSDPKNFGPIPFRFNPLWLLNPPPWMLSPPLGTNGS
jgi:hypothetical protein